MANIGSCMRGIKQLLATDAKSLSKLPQLKKVRMNFNLFNSLTNIHGENYGKQVNPNQNDPHFLEQFHFI